MGPMAAKRSSLFFFKLYQDESSLMADLGFLAHLPELCDVTFMVGPDKVKTNFKKNIFNVHNIHL
jgi:hypothetical protein